VRVYLAGIVTETNTFSPIPRGAAAWETIRDAADSGAGSALDAFRL
jgi:microcystin degradation protein MlrC